MSGSFITVQDTPEHMKLKKLQKELKTELAQAQRVGTVLADISAKAEAASKVFVESRIRLKDARKQAKASKKKLRAIENAERDAKKAVKLSKRRIERLEKKLQRAVSKTKPAAKAAAKAEQRPKRLAQGKDHQSAEGKAA